ncbi:MAG: N-acetylmuramoyl-L-alanine amidase, partial [Verrucomicrobiaceae bacterium]|nr:N-acetylmuramoyl-L-alanine amidase [Verrucomicrobiaceae bacterium]
LKVAQLLKPKLEALGAQVLMVRDANEPVTTARPGDLRSLAMDVLKDHGIIEPKEIYSGIKGDEKVLTVQYQAEKMFYRESEIRARGRKVNEQFRPDVVLCMHFNAASWGDEMNPRYAQENHLHLLVNGCYAAEELQLQDVRFEMLQRLFSQVHDEEMPLADDVARAMAQSTGLPPFVYRTPNARPAGTTGYVYARNLLANRIYQCPVVYLEPYVMNNEETYQRLLMGGYEGATLYQGRLRTSIFEDYVQGIVSGLANYYRQARKS